MRIEIVEQNDGKLPVVVGSDFPGLNEQSNVADLRRAIANFVSSPTFDFIKPPSSGGASQGAPATVPRADEASLLLKSVEHDKKLDYSQIQVRITTADPKKVVQPAAVDEPSGAVLRAVVESKESALRLREREVEVEKEQRRLDAQAEVARAAARDARERLLERVRVRLPDMTQQIGREMRDATVGREDFTPQNDTQLLTAGGGEEAKDASDFFELSLAERDDLLDRVGFYRGIIIDHKRPEVATRSFRDVLRRLDISKEFEDDLVSAGLETAPVRLQYLRPPLTAFYQNKFTFSEHVHQAQKNGVLSLTFSLAVSGGSQTAQAGLGVGAGYGKVSESAEAQAGKRIHITTSYCLPKIELSFEERRPCAALSFVNAVEDALLSMAPAKRLIEVLHLFGHFVAHRMVLGGRLSASKSKTMDGTETTGSATSNQYTQVKLAVSSLAVSGEASAEARNAEREQRAAKARAEVQEMEFTSVGGHGQFLADAGKWSTSLGNHRRWAPILQDDLIPTIRLLRPQQYQECCSVLAQYARERTIREILEDGAHFLFYNEYQTIAGQYARKVYFRIRNRLHDRYLTIAQTAAAGAAIRLSQRTILNPLGQIWHMTGLGYIVSCVTLEGTELAITAMPLEPAKVTPAPSVPPASPTPKTTVTPTPPASPTPETTVTPTPHSDVPAALFLAERGQAANQVWDISASGYLRNVALNRIVDGGDNKVTLEAHKPATFAKRKLWVLQELGNSELIKIERALDEQAERQKAIASSDAHSTRFLPSDEFILVAETRIGRPDLALSIPYISGEVIDQKVQLRPLIYGAHQTWRVDAEGRIQSGVRYKGKPVYLSLRRDECVGVSEATSDNLVRQTWLYDSEAHHLEYDDNGYIVALESQECQIGTDFKLWSLGTENYATLVPHSLQDENWQPQLFGQEAAKLRVTEWLKVVGEGHRACTVTITNDTAAPIVLNGMLALRGAFAPVPDRFLPLTIPSRRQDAARHSVSLYVYNTSTSSHAIAMLTFSPTGNPAVTMGIMVGAAPVMDKNKALALDMQKESLLKAGEEDNAVRDAWFDRWDGNGLRKTSGDLDGLSCDVVVGQGKQCAAEVTFRPKPKSR